MSLCLKYLHDEVERIQKRAMAIIYPHIDYEQSLQKSRLMPLFDRRENQCKKVFVNMQKTSHKLHNLLPDPRILNYDLRRAGAFEGISARTQRYFKSFVPYACRHFV